MGISEERESEAPVSWWDDSLSLARVGAGAARWSADGLGSRQVEFWVDEDLTQPAVPVVRETRAEYRADTARPVAPPKTVVRQPPVEAPKQTMKQTMKRTGVAMKAEKGAVGSGIVKFLRVNGGVYDGRDHQRWMALPERERGLRFQLMKERDAEVAPELKSSRSLPRDFGGVGFD